MKWLVIWWIINTVQIPCPVLLVPDPYHQRDNQITIKSCAVLHTEQRVSVYHELFKTKEEAQAWIAKGPDNVRARAQLIDLGCEVAADADNPELRLTTP